MLEIVQGPIHPIHSIKPIVRLCADRLTLAKRRWRSCAEDGLDFGFDLQTSLQDGDFFFESDSHLYQIVQTAEPVLELFFASSACPGTMAVLGWKIGNLHFPIELDEDCIRVADDPALHRLFEREGIRFAEAVKVFHPLTASAPHGHH